MNAEPTAKTYQPHDIASAFPLMYGPALQRLVDDIREHGQREPIVLLGNMILDGRNRLHACKLANVEPKVRTFGSEPGDGEDPLAFAVSRNSCRRDLNETQRAMIAAELATQQPGGDRRSDHSANLPNGLTQEQAAIALGVSVRSVTSAKKVLEAGTETLICACKHEGGIAVSKASHLVERPDLDEIEQLARRSPKETYTERFLDALDALKNGRDDEPATTNGRGKPEWLMRALARHYSRHGQIVCDPFAGYGSTLRAARDVGRRAIGSEMDVEVAAAAKDLDLRVGRWQDSLANVEFVDAVICDPPYSERTHAAGTTRSDGSDASGLTPTYAGWTEADVHEFVQSWSPRCRGWIVALTDSELIPVFRDAYREAGRYAFAPVPILIRGMSVRVSGDGPSSWCIYAMVARPSTGEFASWDTLPGAYVGTKTKQLETWFDEADGDDAEVADVA